MKLYRAMYTYSSVEGKIITDEQLVFFEAETYPVALEKVASLLTEMLECRENQLEIWNVYGEGDLVMLSIDMGINSERNWRLFEVGHGPDGCTYLDPERDGWPLFLVSPKNLSRLNQALTQCRSAGGQHD